MSPQLQKERIAGSDFDAEVAEKVMGWQWMVYAIKPREGEETAQLHESESVMWKVAPSGVLRSASRWGIPRYSTDVAAAFQIVEAMRAKGFGFHMQDDNGGYAVGFDDWNEHSSGSVHGATAALAISLASLSALSSLESAK